MLWVDVQECRRAGSPHLMTESSVAMEATLLFRPTRPANGSTGSPHCCLRRWAAVTRDSVMTDKVHGIMNGELGGGKVAIPTWQSGGSYKREGWGTSACGMTEDLRRKEGCDVAQDCATVRVEEVLGGYADIKPTLPSFSFPTLSP